MRPSLTCRFLTVGEVSGQRGTFYGRCALGDAEARVRWMNRVDHERLRGLQELRLELSSALRPSIEEFWRLKGHQLRAQRVGKDAESAAFTQALLALSERLTEAIEGFFDEKSGALAELNVPREPLVQLTRLSLDAFVQQTTAEQAEVELPREILSRFPPEVVAFVRPERSTSTA